MTEQFEINEQVWLIWKGCRRKPLFSNKNMAAQLSSLKLHPRDLWNSIWTNGTKVQMFGRNAQTAYQRKRLIPTVEGWWFGLVLQPQDLDLSRMTKRKRIRVLQWSNQKSSQTWLKYCGGTLRELCINQCCKPQWTEGMLWIGVDQHFCTTKWKGNNYFQVIVAKRDSTSCWIVGST